MRNTKAEIYRIYGQSKCRRCSGTIEIPVDQLWRVLREGIEPIDAKFGVGHYSAGTGTSFSFYLDDYGDMRITILEELSEDSIAALAGFLNLCRQKFNDSLRRGALTAGK